MGTPLNMLGKQLQCVTHRLTNRQATLFQKPFLISLLTSNNEGREEEGQNEGENSIK